MEERGSEGHEGGAIKEVGSDYRIDLVRRDLAPAQPAPVRVSRSARPHLTGPLAYVVDHAVAFLAREASRRQVTTVAFGVSWHADPEDGSSTLVLSQRVSADAERAMEYWSLAASALAAFFSSHLPENLRTVATERVSFEVTWDDDTVSVR